MTRELPTYDADRLNRFYSESVKKTSLPAEYKPKSEWASHDRNKSLFVESIIGMYLHQESDEFDDVDPQRDTRVEALYMYLVGRNYKEIRRFMSAHNAETGSVNDYVFEVASTGAKSVNDTFDTNDPSSLRPPKGYEVKRLDDTILHILDSKKNLYFNENYARGLLWILGEREAAFNTQTVRHEVLSTVGGNLARRLAAAQHLNYSTAVQHEDRYFRLGCERVDTLLYLAKRGINGKEARQTALDLEIKSSGSDKIPDDFRTRYEASLAYAIDSLYGDNKVILGQ